MGLWVLTTQKPSSSVFPAAFSLIVSTYMHVLTELRVDWVLPAIIYSYLDIFMLKTMEKKENEVILLPCIWHLLCNYQVPIPFSCGNNLDFYLGILLSPSSVQLSCLRLYPWAPEARETSVVTLLTTVTLGLLWGTSMFSRITERHSLFSHWIGVWDNMVLGDSGSYSITSKRKPI